MDGVSATEPGTRVDPAAQEIRFDGSIVRPEAHVYFMLHKPPGYVCTSSDPQGRPLVIDLIPSDFGRIYNVGRLDADSEGLIILTNDGEFAHRLSHPSHEAIKIYELWLNQPLTDDVRKHWIHGIQCGDEMLKVLKIDPLDAGKSGYGYRVRLGEGRNRHLRRMAEKSNLTVLRLKRVAIGQLAIGTLKRSCWRKLGKSELDLLLMKPAQKTVNPAKKKRIIHPRTVDRNYNPR